VWRKHAALMTHDVFANAFELQKRRAAATFGELAEAKGAGGHLAADVARLQREKNALVDDVGRLQEKVNQLTMRAAELEGSFAAINGAFTSATQELERRAIRIAELAGRNAQLEPAFVQSQESVTALYNEIARLQTLLDTIFTSRTWKLHTMVEKMKGRS
jgi:chromosome segregation ATPase